MWRAASLMAIIPSHMHWDHVSGLADFPDTDVWVQPAEREHAAQGHPPAFLQSQFSGVKRWRELSFLPTPYLGFAAQRDVFGDGSVVLVPLAGHTAGHVGLFLNLPSGRRYFFTGDVTWTLEGLQRPADRPWITRNAVKLDHDSTGNRRAIPALALSLPDDEAPADAALTAATCADEGTEFVALWEELYVLLVPEDHPLALKEALQLADLHGQAFVERSPLRDE